MGWPQARLQDLTFTQREADQTSKNPRTMQDIAADSFSIIVGGEAV